MASGSGGGGGGRRGYGASAFSPALTRGRVNASGGNEVSARQYYSELRRMGASRQEARSYTQEYMRNTFLR